MLLLILVVIMIVGIALIFIGDNMRGNYDDFISGIGLFIFVIIGICFFIALISWPISYYDTESAILKINATKTTIQQARLNNDKQILENVMLQQNIIKTNEWIASAKYWNHTIMDWYWTDKVDTLTWVK